jgi:phage-related protein
MPREADVAFTFDPSQILNGVKQINQQMGNMTRSIAQAGQKMASSVRAGVLRAAAVVGVLGAGFKALKNTIQRMPEVGQAFGIARDIIMKNLLWPLRKELMPLLQRMLDWVRENRARFVQWGQVVANVFRSIVAFVKRAIDFAKQLFERMQILFKTIFGDSTMELADIFNLLLAKFAVIAEFVGSILGDLLDWFVNIVSTYGPEVIEFFRKLALDSGLIASAWELIRSALDMIVRVAGGLITGLNTQLLQISRNVRNVVDDVAALIRAWTQPNEDGYSIVTLAERIGEIFGQILEKITSVIAAFTGPFCEALHGAMTPLNRIVESFQSIWNLIYGGDGINNFMSRLGEYLGDTLMRTLEFIADIILVMEEVVRFISDFFNRVWPEIQEKLGIERGTEDEGGGIFDRDGFLRTWVLRPGGPLGELLSRGAEALRTRDVDDAMITKRGEVVQFNPNDTIFATQNPGAIGGSVSVTIPGMTLYVTEGDARRAGEEFGSGLATQLRDQINSDIERAGVR